jgi:hypothetical protein
MGVTNFLEVARFVMLRGPEAILVRLQIDDPRHNLAVWLGLAGLLWAVWLAYALAHRWRRGVLRLLIAEAACLAIAALGALYWAPLLLWMVNWLNFWVFLVALLALQDLRYQRRPWLYRFGAEMLGRRRTVLH